MRRYAVRRPVTAWYDDEPFRPHLTVYEPSSQPQPTGLLDHPGNEMVLIQEMDPIGFIRLRERE